MRIDVVSDTICPWCFIGKRRLEKALAQRPDLAVEVVWRPFQLNPDMPEEGMDRETYVRLKFGGGDRAKAIYENVRQAGAGEDIPFAFEAIRKTPNTLASHRLLRWAASAGKQDAVLERLFRRYFIEGADVSDHQTLIDVAGDAGMDADLVRELFARGADIDLVRSEEHAARAMGVTGVPFFVVGGRYAVPGAQDPEVLLQVIDLAAREEKEAAGAS
ncbi:MAG: DsbA family oxidoreductase [Alphaproteobacteria bacterium]|nr:DsbA family oxidoreductase [Alphaproteobacteria bacterium]